LRRLVIGGDDIELR